MSVGLLYLIMSSTIGAWAARVPEVKKQTAVGDAAWGLANTVPTVGNAVGLLVVILLIGKVRDRILAIVGAVLVLVNAPLMASASSLVPVIFGLSVWALVAHIMGVPMGAMALEVQKRYGRPIMASFDACFGVGTLLGGAVGTFSAAVGVAPATQFAVSSSVILVALCIVGGWLPSDSIPVERRRRVKLRDRFTKRMLLIALLAFLSAYVIESSVLWSAIYAADVTNGNAAFGGATYTAAATAGTVTLLFVDRATRRVGRVRLFQYCTASSAIAFSVCLLVGSPAAVALGFIALAVGMVCVNPSIYTFAAGQPGISPGEGVSVVELGQMPGGAIAAPALIGLLSGLVGLRMAMGTIVIAALTLSLLVGKVAYESKGSE